MTTRVTVDAHAGWPVEVSVIDWTQSEGIGDLVPASTTKTVVPPHTTQDFYVHSARTLTVKELPL